MYYVKNKFLGRTNNYIWARNDEKADRMLYGERGSRMRVLNMIMMALVLLSASALAGCLQGNGHNGDTLQLKSASYLTEELQKNLSITVIKTGSSSCNVTYTTIDGTALAGQDYTAVSGTLEFLPSETQKDIVIPITADGWYVSPRYFTLKLSSPGNATIRGADSATVTMNASRVVGLYNWTSDSGKRIVDQSGLGNNGVNNMTTLGNDNGAVYRYFNGNGYWANVPSSDSLNITAGTFEAVIKSNKSSIFNTFLCKRYYGRLGGYWFGTDSGGFAYTYFQNDTGHITAFVTNDTNAPDSFISDGKTHFVAASYNTTQYILMVDGKVVFSDYHRHDPIGLTPATFQLSDMVNAADHGMTGNIYWEQIANGAEPVSQMQQDYLKEAWRTGSLTTDLSSAPQQVNITVNSSAPGKAIPSDFLGFSFESPTITQGYFAPDNTVLLRLVDNLGSGVLRFGGNTGDGTYWSRTGETFDGASPPAVAVVSPADLDQLFAFAAAAHWKVILGLNLGHYDPAMAADEAAYASSKNGGTLLAFAVGNEPSYYPFLNPNFNITERPANYSYADYLTEYNSYKAAIREKVPDAPLAGPDGVGYWFSGFDYHLDWYTSFLKDEANDTSLATIHYYAVDPILSDASTAAEESTIKTGVQAAGNMPLRFDESSTTGYDSNFSSALWSADYLFRLAEAGAAGANFHGSLVNVTKAGSYSPLSTNDGHYQANAVYYGMLLFHSAGQGRILHLTQSAGNSLDSFATLGDDGKLRVVLINRDPRQNVIAHITAGQLYKNATAMRLTGTSPDSADHITFAGSQVGADGTWSPSTIEAVDGKDGYFELAVPPTSAVVVTIS